MRHKFRFLFILIPIAFISAAAFATMGLWNWLMPSLFGVGTLTFLKALGIFALARLFFGGRGFGGFRRRRFAFAGHYDPQRQAGWQQRMQEKWQNMGPDQREKFSTRCGKRFHDVKEQTKTETSSQ
jgi:hypothetical protein